MRVFKIILLLVLLVVVCFLTYAFVIYPATWHSRTRRDSIRVLKAAQSIADLTNAVGRLGWFVPLTNNAWIAIRYRDTHSGFIGSSAVARDSGGGWFESDRHFCGSFQYWPHLKDVVETDEELVKVKPELKNQVPLADSDNGISPSYKEMIAIESAPDLESARRALLKIGFKKLQ